MGVSDIYNIVCSCFVDPTDVSRRSSKRVRSERALSSVKLWDAALHSQDGNWTLGKRGATCRLLRKSVIVITAIHSFCALSLWQGRIGALAMCSMARLGRAVVLDGSRALQQGGIAGRLHRVEGTRGHRSQRRKRLAQAAISRSQFSKVTGSRPLP
jgi:hypothetical protein